MRLFRYAILIAGFLVGAPHADAQSVPSRLIEEARVLIDDLEPDSAAKLLEQALRLQPSIPQRVRVFTLLANARLFARDAVGARQAAEQALLLDRSLRVDSLALHTETQSVFAQARLSLGIFADARGPEREVVAPLQLQIRVPEDTSVAASGALEIAASTNRAARVVVAAVRSDDGTSLWSDTLEVGTPRTLWRLQAVDGSPLSPGSYRIHAFALDAQQQVSPTVERTLLLGRSVVDSLPHPPPLGAPAVETRTVRRGSTSTLAAGLLLGVVVAIVPSFAGNAALREASGSTSNYLVAATLSGASILGFVSGSRLVADPEAIRANANTRELDASERKRIIAENERRRRDARIRVQQIGASR